jgi:hypothetical protein
MKNVKLINMLPSAFAFTAIAVIVVPNVTGYKGSLGFSSLIATLFLGAVMLTFVTSAVSTIVAFMRHSLKHAPYTFWLNVLWLAATIVLYAMYAASWEHFGNG